VPVSVHVVGADGLAERPMCKIVLDRAEAANAIDLEMMNALVVAIRKASADGWLSAIILAGGGARHFCAGADMREQRTTEQAGQFRQGLGDMLGAIVAAEKPVIAAVGGAASGAGAMIACAVDAMVMADTAFLAFPELAVGTPPILAFEMAAMRFGEAAAHALVVSGTPVPASDCARLGAADVVAAAEVETAAIGLAAALAARPPAAYALYKRFRGARQARRIDAALQAKAI